MAERLYAEYVLVQNTDGTLSYPAEQYCLDELKTLKDQINSLRELGVEFDGFAESPSGIPVSPTGTILTGVMLLSDCDTGLKIAIHEYTVADETDEVVS